MSAGSDRVERLTRAALALTGPQPSPRDLELWGQLDVRRRTVAEHILWENREALLSSFELLLPALDGGPSAPARASTPLAEEGPIAEVPAPEREAPAALDQSPEERFRRLLAWRNTHSDEQVRGVGDQDLARLASSRATGVADVERASARLVAQTVVTANAQGIAEVLGGPPAAEIVEPVPEPTPEPAPAPVPEPRPVDPVAQPEPRHVDPYAPFVWERVPQFAAYSWSAGPAQPYGHLAADLDDGGVRLAWSRALQPAAVTLYRVVESDSSWPAGAPELGGLIGVTQATSGTVTLRPAGPVTYLAVWVNQGDTLLDAVHAQPLLVGTGQIVWPPSELSVQVTANRTVAALFNAPAGSRVEVQRFPAGVSVTYDINREIDKAMVGSTGFRDLTPPMGEDIVYAAFCVAQLADGSSVVSRPATAEAHVTPEVEQIAVQVKRSDTTPGAYDISWLPPRHGRVVLFATPEHPPHGLENEPRTAEIIEGQGLTGEFRVNYPPADLGGIMTISGFAVDQRWVRAHFVAVHWVSDESVWVGPTVSMVTPHAPSYAEIVERVDSEIVTFAWPEGVTVVQAYQGPRGGTVDPVGSEPIAQLTRDQYVRTGGMRITRTLPSNGCAIHLFGVVYLDGRPIYSDATTLDYPGMTRLTYRVVPYGADGAPSQAGARPASYRIFAEVDDDLHDTPLAVVARPARLPLHPQDGMLLAQPVVSLRAGVPTYIEEFAAGGRVAFLRVFVNLAPADCGAVAVLDPGVAMLEVVV